MAAILMPDINLRRRRRRLEQHWGHVLHEDRRDHDAPRPLLAPSSPSALDSGSSAHPFCRTRALSLRSRMQRFVAPLATCLYAAADDDAGASEATSSRCRVKSFEDLSVRVSSLSVSNNQDNEDGLLRGVDSSETKLLNASHSEPTATTQPSTTTMGLQPVSTMTSACVKTLTRTVKSAPITHSPGPTLGAVMEAVSRNETDIDELDFSFLIKRNKRLEAEGCALVARALETNRTVRRLIIREHDIGDEGAAAIAAMLCRNATLQYVDLYGNNITDEGAEALAQALYGHATLTHLQLWSNQITDRGAQALAEAIKCNCSLVYLGLVQNSIAQVGAQALLDALDVNIQLETLNLATNEGVPAWLIAQIRAVLARNRLEAPQKGVTWDSTPAPEAASNYTEESGGVSRQESDGIDDETERDYTSSISGSDASGFLSCSGATASAISADGIWI